MTAVATGFVAILFVIAVGYLLGGTSAFPAGAQKTLAALAFNVGSPALMVQLMAQADLASVFSWHLAALGGAGLLVMGLTWVLWRKLSTPQLVMSFMGAAYLNSGNLGLPVAYYVLGDATWVAPVLLLQVGLIQPALLAVMDASYAKQSRQRLGVTGIARLIYRNPVTLGTVAGLMLNLAELRLPEVLSAPVALLAGLSIPLMLLTFGLGLRHSGIPTRFAPRAVWLVAAKTLLFPALAWALALAMGLPGVQARAATVLAALPTAQVVLVHAIRYDTDQEMTREVLFATTVLSLPAVALASLV